MDKHLWETVEGLFSPIPDIRESSLENLKEIDNYYRSPLLASILVSRISEPDLEIRFHIIQFLGGLLDFDTSEQHFSDQALIYAKDALDQLEKNQLLRLLEVADNYITAEEPIKNILKLSSYAGVGLSGILNDWKLSASIRNLAIFYCGEVGYLSSRPALQNLAQRITKSRNRSREGNESKRMRDEEFLYPSVISALEKLKP